MVAGIRRRCGPDAYPQRGLQATIVVRMVLVRGYEGLVLSCCNCAVGRAHMLETESSGFGGNSIRQRAATFSLPDSVSKRAVVDKRSSLREESVKRYVHDLSEEFAHPKINVLHLPQHFSQLEARNTDDDNAKQQKRKIEYSSIRSLSYVHQFRTPCSNRRRKGQFSTRPRGTIAVLAKTNAIFSLYNRAAGRGPYISYGRNLWTCLNRPEFIYISIV